MDELDLNGMDFSAARAYVLSYLGAWKQARKGRSALQEEVSLWERRVKLAAQRGDAALQAAASEKLASLQAGLASLQSEELELARKAGILKEKLVRLRVQSSLTVDVDQALAELSVLLGEPDTTAQRMKEEEAAAALEELKKRLKGE